MQEVSFDAVASLPAGAPDCILRYGDDESQFVEQWHPKGKSRDQVVIVIHGGCWRAEYDCRHARPMCNALAQEGLTVFSLEYRRLGHDGGGWPGTFEDVLAGVSCVTQQAGGLPLTVLGHSAGGHLALWLAGRADPATHISRCIALNAVSDVRSFATGESPCQLAARELLATVPVDVEISPAVPGVDADVVLLHGARDTVVPLAQSERFAAKYASRLTALPDAGHFDLIHPGANAWQTVADEIFRS